METETLQSYFKKAITKFNPVQIEFYDFVIQTKIGILKVSWMDSWIAASFDNVETAKKHFGVRDGDFSSRLNPYSGKWNWLDIEFLPHGIKATKMEKKNASKKMIDAFVLAVEKFV